MSNNQYLAELLIMQLLPARSKLYTFLFPKSIFVNNCEGSMAKQVNAHKVRKVIKSRLLRKLSLKYNICFTLRSGYILYLFTSVYFVFIHLGIFCILSPQYILYLFTLVYSVFFHLSIFCIYSPRYIHDGGGKKGRKDVRKRSSWAVLHLGHR